MTERKVHKKRMKEKGNEERKKRKKIEGKQEVRRVGRKLRRNG